MAARAPPSLKLPGYSRKDEKERSKFTQPTLSRAGGSFVSSLSQGDLEVLLGGPLHSLKFPKYLNLSSSEYQLVDTSFLRHLPNVLKELDLSNNKISDISLQDLSKLKRLILNDTELESLVLADLPSLLVLSACGNKLTQMPVLNQCPHLLTLQLGRNRIRGGFYQLESMKELELLDLSKNKLTYPIGQFYEYIIQPLKQCPKLQYVDFSGNIFADKIPQFRLFVLNELPRLRYINWREVKKEDSKLALQYSTDNMWADKVVIGAPLTETFRHTGHSSQSGLVEKSPSECALASTPNIPFCAPLSATLPCPTTALPIPPAHTYTHSHSHSSSSFSTSAPLHTLSAQPDAANLEGSHLNLPKAGVSRKNSAVRAAILESLLREDSDDDLDPTAAINLTSRVLRPGRMSATDGCDPPVRREFNRWGTCPSDFFSSISEKHKLANNRRSKDDMDVDLPPVEETDSLVERGAGAGMPTVGLYPPALEVNLRVLQAYISGGSSSGCAADAVGK